MNRYLLTSSLAVALFIVFLPVIPVAHASIVEEDVLGQSVSPKLMIRNESQPLVPDELFGAKGGYFHPFVSVTASFSDNIYNSNNKTSDWLMTYSPGIWLAVPASKDIILNLSTNNTSPGGHFQAINKVKRFSRYQTYAMYVADITDYNSHSDRDNAKQSVEGFFQVNLRSGLSIDMFDKFTDSQDPLGITGSTVAEEFKSNLFGVIADYDLTEKFSLRADYTNFDLNYDDVANEWRDRTDNSIAAYLYYKYTEKTSVFFQYEFIDLSYKTSKLLDNKQHYTYVGMDWRPTDKTTLKGKVGVAVRDATLDDGDITEPAFELTADYKMTGKTSAQVILSQKIGESTALTSNYSIDRKINLAFFTQFTEKLGARLQFGFGQNNYDGGTVDRDDDIYNASLVGTYALKDWLKAEAGYSYTDQDSSLDLNDYSTNLLYVKLSAGF
ncbi:MAG: outer membrane beta-barrel protein [Proteobacteria bacterium]|nr:outer membrane beta-barrel protein [Pseudomonadota bacterium]